MFKSICFTLVLFFHTAHLVAQANITVYFSFGSATLSAVEREKMASLARNTNIVTITGHTDTVGTVSFNEKLAATRINSVVSVLNDLQTNNNFIIINKGELSAVADIDSLNRCVVITLKKVEQPVAAVMAYSKPDTVQHQRVLVEKFTIQDLLFVHDKAQLEPSSVYLVERTAKYLLKFPQYEFEIRGHVNFSADLKLEPNSLPFQLSVDRAELVKGMLNDYGVPLKQMKAEGWGNRELLFPNPKSLEEQQKNMRVEILIYR